MPDHIAELSATNLTAALEEREEPNLVLARERVLAYERSGPLTSAEATLMTDAALDGASAPAHMLTVRSGSAHNWHVETVALVAFPGLPLVDVVVRSDGEAVAHAAVLSFVRSLRCMK